LQARIDQLSKAQDEQAKKSLERDKRLDKAQQAYQSLEKEKKETEQENELILLQLHQVQEELEDIFLRNQNLNQAHQRLETSQRESAQANALLVEALQELKSTLAARDTEIEKQRQRNIKLKKTVSWKITAPLRTISRPFTKSIKEQRKTQKQIELLKKSGQFDQDWYLSVNDDVAMQKNDPVEHYVRHGAAEGRNPSPGFDAQRYLEINPDVAQKGMNPFVHFVKYGMAEGRAIANEA
jgi:hypothetical protein